MKLAAKKEHQAGATVLQKGFSETIKLRLVSQYSHSGVVIDGALYNVTGLHGYEVLKPGEWDTGLWDFFDVGGDDERAKLEFEAASQPPKSPFKRFIWKLCKGYDWFSLLAFVGPLVRVSWLNYCFELSYRMMTGLTPTRRVTIEVLLAEGFRVKSGKV